MCQIEFARVIIPVFDAINSFMGEKGGKTMTDQLMPKPFYPEGEEPETPVDEDLTQKLPRPPFHTDAELDEIDPFQTKYERE